MPAEHVLVMRSMSFPSSRKARIRIVAAVGLMIAAQLQTGACALSARSGVAQGSWNRVMQLDVGAEVEIERWDRPDISGEVVGADPASLSVGLHVGAPPQRILRTEIRRIRFVRADRSDSLKNGTLVGAAVGVGYVIGMLAYIAAGGEEGEPSTAQWFTGPLIGAAAGAGIGAWIDSARAGKRKETVFVGRR